MESRPQPSNSLKSLFIFFLAIISPIASAQTFSVSGQLTDSLGNPMTSATVMMLDSQDSSLVNFTVANPEGNFTFSGLQEKEYLLKATFMGYRPYETLISARNGQDVQLGKITMEPLSNKLEEVEILADRAPVIVKKDTIEFNAESFKTKENAMVEDLLKKLPGVEVDNDGNITAQGEQVKSVTVDGKQFFGRDPKIATKNLPADAVDKVQVFDKLSDQATFTGIDDGEREKTINLELKEEKRNAMFGNMMAGAGTEESLQAKVSLNKFTKSNQLSFLGMANNVNQAGFGMDEYMNFTGGSRQMMGGGAVRIQMNAENTNGVPLNFANRANGLMSTYAGGINLNNQVSDKTEVNGSYFYNHLGHKLDQITYRENFLQNGNFTFNENKLENNTNSNHRANTTLNHKIDSANTLRLNTTFSLNETDSEYSSSSDNIAPDGDVASKSARHYLSEGTRTSFATNLLYRHRFEKTGRSVSANLTFNANQNESTGLLDATTTLYREEISEDYLQQSSDQSTDYLSYGAMLSYTEPIGNRKYLEANYNFRLNMNDVERNVFDISNGEASFDETLSNRYNSNYEFHRAGLNFRIAETDYNLVAGASTQQTRLRGKTELLNAETEKSFTNVLPSLRFNYDFTSTKHLRLDYETSVREPEIQQLQPIVDNSDPLNIYQGNPELRPSYSQSWRVNFTSFNPVNFMNVFAFADFDHTSNAIINAQNIDEQFVRTITPVNVSKNVSLNTNVNLGIPLRKLNSRFNITGRFRSSKSIAVLNDDENDIAQRSTGATLRYTYEYTDNFDLTLNASMDHQKTAYGFDQPDQSFLNGLFGAESNVSFLKNYLLNANVEYLTYDNKSSGFEQAIVLLNLSLSHFFLKGKSGELKLSVNNLLDQALGVDQTASINYLERVTTNSLGRYFMISFTYVLNKQLNPMAMRRKGPMMRIQR